MNETKEHSHFTLILWCVALVVVLLALGVVMQFVGKSPEPIAPNMPEEPMVPVFSEETRTKLAASNGFDVLVSYTDRGFEPDTITVAAGERVRFSNNAQAALKIGEAQGSNYGEGACDTGALLACAVTEPRDFWEFTFTTPGVWTIVNTLNTTHQAVIRVE